MRLLLGRHVGLFGSGFPGRATSWAGGVSGWLWSCSSNQRLPKRPLLGHVWRTFLLLQPGAKSNHIQQGDGTISDGDTVPGLTCPLASLGIAVLLLSHGGDFLSHALW